MQQPGITRWLCQGKVNLFFNEMSYFVAHSSDLGSSSVLPKSLKSQFRLEYGGKLILLSANLHLMGIGIDNSKYWQSFSLIPIMVSIPPPLR